MRDVWLAPKYVVRALCEAPIFKALVTGMVWIGEYVFGSAALAQAAVGCLVLIILDTCTGFYAAIVTKQDITSARLSRVLVKVLSYGSVAVVVAILTRHMPGLNDLHEACMGLVVAVVMATEALSVLENVERMGLKGFGWLSRMLKGRLREIERTPIGGEE